MTVEEAIRILKERKREIEALKQLQLWSYEFKKWQRDAEVSIGKIFGDTGRHVKDFTAIYYASCVIDWGADSDTRDHQRYVDGLDEAAAVLSSMIDEVHLFGLADSSAVELDTADLLSVICERFHLVARQLRSRHGGRSTLVIEDEYDVQDLLHALLFIHFDDVRSEESTPSYAGGCSRVDFLLKKEQTVVEVKKTRKGLTSTNLGAELLVDIARYSKHPDCQRLVCFVYDPEGLLGNPLGIEGDLSTNEGQLPVRVIVTPKGK